MYLVYESVHVRRNLANLDLPVDGCLPERVIEAVEKVQEHGPSKTRVGPVFIKGRISTGVQLFVSVSTAPDSHCHNEKHDQASLCSNRTAPTLHVKEITKEQSTYDLCQVEKETVEGFCASVEAETIDIVLLVGIEPVGRPEHWEKENDKWLEFQGLPKSSNLGLPTGVLHQDNAASVGSDDIFGIAKAEGETGAAEHEDDEGNVSTISDRAVCPDIDVLAKWNLELCY